MSKCNFHMAKLEGETWRLCMCLLGCLNTMCDQYNNPKAKQKQSQHVTGWTWKRKEFDRLCPKISQDYYTTYHQLYPLQSHLQVAKTRASESRMACFNRGGFTSVREWIILLQNILNLRYWISNNVALWFSCSVLSCKLNSQPYCEAKDPWQP
jgi:hypothetical protein